MTESLSRLTRTMLLPTYYFLLLGPALGQFCYTRFMR